MWLLNARTLKLEQFFEAKAPPYAILSHTWGGEEVTFQEMQENEKRIKRRAGYLKIHNCCAEAVRDGYEYVWVDTCCIDKSSSAELSEAINSMFRWYQNADICYAYLSDMPSASSWERRVRNKLRLSRWFQRGWTLQELIAPKVVEFLAADWSSIGTKSSLQKEISETTGIRLDILGGAQLSTCSVAEKMTWAASRQTTRVEDMAYSLLGIFQVSMPLLYGEGNRAFLRLQEEILKTTEDYTIFAWNAYPFDYTPEVGQVLSPLAYSPVQFRHELADGLRYSDLEPIEPGLFKMYDGKTGVEDSDLQLVGFGLEDAPPLLTARGLRVCLPLCVTPSGLYLACIYSRKKTTKDLVCMGLRLASEDSGHSNTFRWKLINGIAWHDVSPNSWSLSRFRRSTIYIELGPELQNLAKDEGDELFQVRSTIGLWNSGCQAYEALQFAQAEGYFARVLRTRKKILPSHSPYVLAAMKALSHTYVKQKRYKKAEALEAEAGVLDETKLHALKSYPVEVSPGEFVKPRKNPFG